MRKLKRKPLSREMVAELSGLIDDYCAKYGMNLEEFGEFVDLSRSMMEAIHYGLRVDFYDSTLIKLSYAIRLPPSICALRELYYEEDLVA